jgi:predicted enzyme related to lactoylglutathione lyase
MQSDITTASPLLAVAAIRIFSRDLAVDRAFYSERLRLVESVVTRDWLVYAVGDVDVIVEQVERDDPESTELVGRYTAFSFSVDDVHLRAHGVDVLGEPEEQSWGGILAHIADPSGNVLTLVQYSKGSA